jgi:hypothetical protein
MSHYEVHISLNSDDDRETIADKLLAVLPTNAAMSIQELPEQASEEMPTH